LVRLRTWDKTFGLVIGLSRVVQEACNEPHVTLKPQVAISHEDRVFNQTVATSSATPTLGSPAVADERAGEIGLAMGFNI
jgi:hypothetical protein